MNADDQPGLFDIHEGESAARPERPPRGRNRQAWTRTATAEVTITDPDALRSAATRAEESAVTIALDPGAPDEDAAAVNPGEGVGSDAFDALGWLVWPTDGLEPLLEVGAVRVLSVDSQVEAQSVDRGNLSWAVTVKLNDVHKLRRIAAQAHPEQAAQVADSLAAAWQCAAHPFAPLRSIPGITWQPGPVKVQQLPARSRRSGTGAR